MRTQKNSRTIQVGFIIILVFGMDLNLQPAFGQSDTRQGSGTTQDPFQVPTGSSATGQDDPFQLPGVPPLPGEDPTSVEPRSFQDVLVNEKYAGWDQASDGTTGSRLDETIRAQWVMADESGKVGGVVYGIEGADIGNLTIYLLNNGREVTNIRPQEDGTFVFANVRQGVYSLIGWGDNAFFAFGVNILRYNPESDANVPTELKITATQNETTINTDWIQFFAQQVKFPVYGRHITGDGENDPPNLYGVDAQQLYMPAARPATSISSHQVIPAPDGRVIGRVHQMSTRNGRPVDLRNTRILLLKNDDVYAAVTTDAYGVFEFPEIPAGEYSCVAVGQDGLGCIGIYMGEPASADDEFAPISFTMTTSETTGWLNNVAIETAYQRIISRPRYNYEEEECYGGFGGRGYQGPGALRPGGYRPQPRSAIPKDQRFLRKANRFVDGLFFRDSGGAAAGAGNGYYGQGGGYGFNGGANGGGFAAPPAPGGAVFGGSASRIPIPETKRK